LLVTSGTAAAAMSATAPSVRVTSDSPEGG